MKRQKSTTKIAIALATLALVTTNVSAQSNQSETRCPDVTVSLLDGFPRNQVPWTYLANVGDVSPGLNLSYKWSARNGQIVSGQGTPRVKVLGNHVRRMFNRNGRIVEGSLLEPFTVTVTGIGAPTQCHNTTASMSFIGEPPPPVAKIEEFGSLSFRDLTPKLDSFAQMVRMNPGAVGYILSVGKWSLQKRAIQYLVKNQRLNAERLTYVEKKKTDELNVKLYVIPEGASPPN